MWTSAIWLKHKYICLYTLFCPFTHFSFLSFFVLLIYSITFCVILKLEALRFASIAWMCVLLSLALHICCLARRPLRNKQHENISCRQRKSDKNVRRKNKRNMFQVQGIVFSYFKLFACSDWSLILWCMFLHVRVMKSIFTLYVIHSNKTNIWYNGP
jgi:membrane protein required for beta-lactamase induction